MPAIQPIVPLDAFTPPPALAPTGAAKPTGESAFTRVVREFIEDVNHDQLQADVAVERLVTGQTDNIHEVMLQLSQADLTFRMALEVRNRMIEAYQEVSRMTV